MRGSRTITLVGGVVGLALGLLVAGCSSMWSDLHAGARDQGVQGDGGAASVQWAVVLGGGVDCEVTSIAVDNVGSIYVLGRFPNTITFGATTLTTKGSYDIFLAKLDSYGKFLWATSAGNEETDRALAMALDGSGNVYLTGRFYKTVAFGSTKLVSKGITDIFVTKLGSDGKFAWAVSAGGTSWDDGQGIAVDNAGNIHVTGFFTREAAFGPHTLTPKGTSNLFVTKLDNIGNFVAAVGVGGTHFTDGHSIAATSSGDALVAGTFSGKAAFGSTTLTSSGDEDIVVAKLDSNSKFVWATSGGGSQRDQVTGISLDGAGNAHVAGLFEGKATLGSATLTSSGKTDSFVARIGSDGKFAWAAQAGGPDDVRSVSIVATPAGHSYTIGEFRGAAKFGSTTLTSKGGRDIFVAEFDGKGKLASTVQIGSKGEYEFGGGITLDRSGDVYLTGEFDDTVTLGNIPITSTNKNDFFVAKLRYLSR